MSVLKRNRGQSEAEFVYAARELQIYTVRKCANLPKRYTFYVSRPLAMSATLIHTLAKMGDSLHPEREDEGKMRRACLLAAYALSRAIIAQIEAVNEITPMEAKTLEGWAALAVKETGLLRGVLDRDWRRGGAGKPTAGAAPGGESAGG